MSATASQTQAATAGQTQAPPTRPWTLETEPGESRLRRRREELASQIAELHWNLGGLAYEMAIRDHFRLDVLLRRAAILQEREIELNELDRVLNDGA